MGDGRGLITYQLHDEQARAALRGMLAKSSNLRVPLMQIGELLTVSTKARFQTSTAPDGSAWAKNSPVTISRYVKSRSGTLSKDKKLLSAKGERLWENKKPLIGRSLMLGHTIIWQMLGANLLAVGTPMIYGPVQQFGAGKGEFGKGAPWGDIPARPFLGLSADDSAEIVQISVRFLAQI